MLVFLLPSGSAAANPTLEAIVGPGFNITLKDSNGVNVTHLDPGAYDIHVVDAATVHNFHLSGPGVNEATSLEETQTVTWTVTFTDGVYTFLCDAHPTQMKGAFAVGTATLPPSASAASRSAALRVRQGDEAEGLRWPRLHDLAQGRRRKSGQEGEGRNHIQGLGRRQVDESRLPSHGSWRQQEDSGGQEGDDHLEAEVQEGDVPLPMRSTQVRHEGKLQGLVEHEADGRRPVSPPQRAGRSPLVAPVLAAAPEHQLDGRSDAAGEEESRAEGGRGQRRDVHAHLGRSAQRIDRMSQPFALELDLAADRVGSLALSFCHCLP